MNISEFILRIALLLLPGIIAVKVYRKLKGNTRKKDWEDFIDLLIFSLVSYLIYAVIYGIAQGSYTSIIALQAIYDATVPIDWFEIFCSSLIGIVLAFIASFIYKKKLINRLGQATKVTNRYGDEDIWDYFHNMPDIEWVVVRDHQVGLYYFCYIKVFSESKERRELLLGDVTVYNEDGKFCYNTDAMYICRDYYDITIEIPQIPDNSLQKKED